MFKNFKKVVVFLLAATMSLTAFACQDPSNVNDGRTQVNIGFLYGKD